MKLFTTITSERGKPITKSGNDHITIDINSERQFFARLHINYYKDSEGLEHYRLFYQPENEKGYHEELKHIII